MISNPFIKIKMNILVPVSGTQPQTSNQIIVVAMNMRNKIIKPRSNRLMMICMTSLVLYMQGAIPTKEVHEQDG